MFEDVPHVDAARDEARSILLQRSQQPFSALIDERYVAQVDDARPAVRFGPAAFPYRSPFLDPWTAQLAA
jgi:hypothetical protein